MVFSGFVFLFGFLPAVLLLYYLAPRQLRNPVLLLMSLLFYGWAAPEHLWLMAVMILFNYALALPIAKYRRSPAGRWFLAAAVGGNLLCLGYFKYASLLFPVLLPMGISFYTFQAMSYCVDVYRADAPVQKNLLTFGTYITLFPQLIAGPILRYGDMARQLEHRRERVWEFASGVQLFAVGLSKKLLLANPMGQLWQRLQEDGGAFSGWMGLVAFSFQIYFDFSGYSDMARGLGRMLGFSFGPNFDYPYISRSITEFWRRWHISLSSWFREYVYIPLGGNRKGLARQCVNILIVWGLTGLWHGAGVNFLLWGLYYGLLLMLEKIFLLALLKKLPPFLGRCYTLVLVVLGWGLFYFEDFRLLGQFFTRLFSLAPTGAAALLALRANLLLLLTAAVAATPVPRRIMLKNRSRVWVRWGKVAFAAAALMLCLSALASQSYNPFLYFRF